MDEQAQDERDRLLAQIERKGAEWMLTFDSIAMPILLISHDAHITRLNLAARELAGASFEELVGRPLSSFGDAEPWKTLREAVTAVLDTHMACTAQIVSGETNWDVSANPAARGTSDDERVIVAMRDMTEIVRLQDSVRRGEQLAALGELVAGVAHEIMNPLFGMATMLDVIDSQIEDRPETLELTATLRKWIDRLRSLTENLLAYGRTWSIDLEPRNVREVLEQAIATSRPRAGDNGVSIDDHVGEADGMVLMDSSRLVLVFENLLTNAMQHSGTGSRIAVTAKRHEDAVEVIVRDYGPGFNPADLPRVFEPFFTRRRGGTGLGLSIVQRIVDEHGGTVSASNAAEGGAAVLVRLPIYAELPQT